MTTTPQQTSPQPWTPTLQAQTSRLRIAKLLELGQNEKGRFARVEFEDESSRPLYLLTIADAWHPLFQSLDPKACWKIRDHYVAKHPQIRKPDGSKKQFDRVSFSTTTLSADGRKVSSRRFDSEAYADQDGYIAGLKIAREFLELQETPAGSSFLSFSQLINDLARPSSEHEEQARWGFMVVLNRIVADGARTIDFRSLVDGMIEQQRVHMERQSQEDARNKDAIRERMALVRQAKKKEREAATASPVSH